MKRKILLWILSLATGLPVLSARASFVVEAEFFDDLGGWVLDEQFYEQVGSAYLMAHGAGKRVEDAVTTVNVPSAGHYHVWVRTFNWNAPWDASQAPGIFQLLVNGKAVCKRLGDCPEQWGWQYAGSVRVPKGNVKLALHDLTGFDGRCDAIFFSKDRHAAMPNERHIPSVSCPDKYDLIVVGAGSAGIPAAVAAARTGLKVLLLDDKVHAGGNSAPEVRIIQSGRVHEGRYPKLGNVVCEYGLAFRDYPAFIDKLESEDNMTVRLSHRVVGVKMDGDRIVSVTALNFGEHRIEEYSGRYFADCTGDANLGVLAGAEYMMGAETSDVYGETLAPDEPVARSLGSTVKWTAVRTGTPVDFPLTPWAKQFTDSTARPVMGNKWWWEAGFDRDQISDGEWIRDYMFRVIYGNWSWLKHSSEYSEEFACADLTAGSVSTVLGKRESRRLKGDVVINQNDCYGKWKRWPDAAVWATYPIDQHFPNPELSEIMPGEEFESVNKHNFNDLGVSFHNLVEGKDYQNPYMIPYRCLYSVNVENMFMAGRNISGSRIAMCSYRVGGTCALMGEVVGLAARVCVNHSCTPREVYTNHLQELLSVLGAGVPPKYIEIYSPN